MNAPPDRPMHPGQSPRTRRRRLPAVLVAALLLGVVSCTSSKGTTSPAIESLTLTPTGWQTQAVVGQTVVLETKVTDASGSPVSGISLSYTSSDTTVLRVSQTNATEASVTAVGPGTANLAVALASGSGGSASAGSVSVQVTVDLAGVEIEGAGTPVVRTSVGDSAVVQARGLDVAGNTVAGGGLEWSVAGGGVASVTPYAGGDSAKVVAVRPGTDTLKVTAALCAKGCGATRVVEVKQAVASIQMSPDSASVVAGDSAVFQAVAYDASGAPVPGAPIRWTIGNPTLATVDTSGVVHAWHTGVTQVTAFDDAVNAKATVDVVPGPATQLLFTTQPSDTSTGMALSPAVRVTEEDAYGNVATGATDAVTVALGTNPGGATLAGTTTEAAVVGVATFSDLSVDKAGSGYTLVARAGALPSVTSAAFDIHNDVPTGAASSDTTPENTKLVVSAPGVLAKDKSPAGNPLTAMLVTRPSHGTLVLNADGSFTYTPATDYNGNDSFTYEATDGTYTSVAATVSLTVIPVNQAPSYTACSSQTSLENGGAQSATWATSVSPGPANESSQTVHFTVTSTDSSLFSAQPAISSTGTLTYTAAVDSFGVDTVGVQLWDDGGTANGGVDSTTVSTFTITVTHVNQPPSFTLDSTNVTALEDGSADTVPGLVTNISPGPANESSQTVHFTVTSTDSSLFSVQPVISASGTLTFAATPDSSGVDTVTVTAKDNGGTANGGVDTTREKFTITVTLVNDAPSYTAGGNVTSLENRGAQSVAWATSVSPGPANESSQTVHFTVTSTDSSLFSAQPAISSSGTLTYTAAVDSFGVDTVGVQLWDDGGTANGGVDSTAVSTFTITVTHVNQPPSFTAGANQVVWHDAGAQTVTNWATSISPGPANESSQTLSFHLTNTDGSLFSAGPAISSSGTLTFTPATTADGTDTVSVTLKDNGGTANGGVDSTATQTFTIAVGPVAYVTSNFSAVSAINVPSGTVTKTISPGNVNSVAFTPDGSKAYVTSGGSTISVIDVAADTAFTNTIVGTSFNQVAFTPDGTKAYVTGGTSTVSVIDVATGGVTSVLGGFSQPDAVAVTPNGTKAYVVNRTGYDVTVIDGAADTVLTHIGVGSNPRGLAITPDGTKAYVPNLGSNTVSVIDVVADTAFTHAITVGSEPGAVAITPDGTKAYVANVGSNDISVIDVATDTVARTITGFDAPEAIAFTPDGKEAYVANFSGGSVSVVDVATGTVVGTIAAGSFQASVAIH